MSEFERLFLHAPFGYITTRADGVVELVNDTLLEWVGRERGEVAGSGFALLLDTPSRLFWETRHQSVLLLRGEAREVALTLLTAGGGTLPVLASSVVEGDEVRIALLAVTERIEYERALLESTRTAERTGARLQVLQESGAALIGTVSETEVIDSLVASTARAFDASTVTVFLFDDSGELRSVGGKHRVPAPAGGAWRSITERRPVTVSDLGQAGHDFPAFVEIMRDDRIEAFSAVPLMADGPAFGALLCTFARPRQIDDELVELQAALALQATEALVRLRLQARLERQALHDPLTGLANRQLLHERLDEALAVANRTGHPLAVLFFDLDGFKQINDAEGHATGDAVLIEVARRLSAAVRAGDACARYGGDEFVVVCERAGDAEARVVAERVRRGMTRPYTITSRPMSASIGVAVLPSGAVATADSLLEAADAAMYDAKQSGRDRVALVTI